VGAAFSRDFLYYQIATQPARHRPPEADSGEAGEYLGFTRAFETTFT